MPASIENAAVATGLEKVGFHSNLKDWIKVLIHINSVSLGELLDFSVSLFIWKIDK